MIIYINGMLIMSDSKVEAVQYLEVLVYFLESLTFIINWEKSLLTPVQEIEFLGLMADSASIQLKLPVKNCGRSAGKQATF